MVYPILTAPPVIAHSAVARRIQPVQESFSTLHGVKRTREGELLAGTVAIRDVEFITALCCTRHDRFHRLTATSGYKPQGLRCAFRNCKGSVQRRLLTSAAHHVSRCQRLEGTTIADNGELRRENPYLNDRRARGNCQRHSSVSSARRAALGNDAVQPGVLFGTFKSPGLGHHHRVA